jgi:hypothetical protein
MADSTPDYGICAYCGSFGEVTDDHVVPQCLWSGRVPKDAPNVDACKKCNNEEKSRNDAYLRDFLTMDMANESQPVRERIYPKFMRAVQRNQSVFAHHAQRSQLVELVTPGGLFAGYAHGIQLPTQQITKELTTIVRGLFYVYIGKNIGITLPETTPFEVFRQRDMNEVIQNIGLLLNMGGVSVSVGTGEVFECAYGCAAEKPDVSLWYLNFYQRVVFSVATNRRGSASNNR